MARPGVSVSACRRPADGRRRPLVPTSGRRPSACPSRRPGRARAASPGCSGPRGAPRGRRRRSRASRWRRRGERGSCSSSRTSTSAPDAGMQRDDRVGGRPVRHALVDEGVDEDAADRRDLAQVDEEVLPAGLRAAAVVAVEPADRVRPVGVPVAERVAERLDDALGPVGVLVQAGQVEVDGARARAGRPAEEPGPGRWPGRTRVPVEVDPQGAGRGPALGERHGRGRLRQRHLRQRTPAAWCSRSGVVLDGGAAGRRVPAAATRGAWCSRSARLTPSGGGRARP